MASSGLQEQEQALVAYINEPSEYVQQRLLQAFSKR